MQPKRISSTSNAIVREAARLKRKRHRYQGRLFLAEGEDLLDAAFASGVVPRQVFVLEGYEDLLAGDTAKQVLSTRPASQKPAPEVFVCSRAVMEKLSELGSGSRVIAAFEMLDRKFPAGLEKIVAGPVSDVDADDGARRGCASQAESGSWGESGRQAENGRLAENGSREEHGRRGENGRLADREVPSGPLLYLAGTGDPGNVGTMIRSAAALGVEAVVMGPNTADPYSTKSLRATMGAVFRMPIYLTVNPETLVSWAERAGVPVVCADAHGGMPVWEAPLAGTFVLVMGSEREGVPHRLLDAATETVHIPHQEETESINVAMAGSVILYEALRQRSG